MELDQKSINSFKEAYQKEYGILLNDGDATELANRLYTLMDATHKGNRNFYKSIPVNLLFKNVNQ